MRSEGKIPCVSHLMSAAGIDNAGPGHISRRCCGVIISAINLHFWPFPTPPSVNPPSRQPRRCLMYPPPSLVLALPLAPTTQTTSLGGRGMTRLNLAYVRSDRVSAPHAGTTELEARFGPLRGCDFPATSPARPYLACSLVNATLGPAHATPRAGHTSAPGMLIRRTVVCSGLAVAMDVECDGGSCAFLSCVSLGKGVSMW